MSSQDEQFKKKIKTELASSKNADAAKNALALLFPVVERVVEAYVTSDRDTLSQRANRRISQKDFSSAYFSMNPQSASWGRSEFQRLISEGPEAAFSALETRAQSSPADQATLRRLFLELLDAAFSTSVEMTQNWLDHIIVESPKLINAKDRAHESPFSFENEDRLRWLVIHALEKLPIDRRVNLMKNAIQRAIDLTLMADVVRGVVGDKNPEGATGRSREAGLGEEAETIRNLLLSRIRRLTPRGKFWEQARPAQLLWFWWGCDLQSEVFAFTSSAMRTKTGLLGLLQAPIGTVVSSDEGSFERVNKQSWSKVVNLDLLISRAKKLSRTTASQREREIAARFLNAVERDKDF